MSRRQKIVVIVGVVAIVGMCVFPPQGHRSEYRPIWSGAGQIDATRLVLQVFIAVAVTGGVVVGIKSFRLPRQMVNRAVSATKLAALATARFLVVVMIATAITAGATFAVMRYQSWADRRDEEQQQREDVRLLRSHGKASAKPAKSTLAFRIVPNATGSSRRPVLPLFVGRTKENFVKRAMADLAARGPGAVTNGDSGLKLRWLELACDAPAGGVVGKHKGKRYILLCDDPHYIMVRGTGKDAWGLTGVDRVTGSGRGGPSILVKFDQRGALRTKQITQANKGNVMAVVIDGKVVVAPVIRSTMSTHAVITGTFTDAEVARLIRTLRTGMPASRGKDQSHRSQSAPRRDPLARISEGALKK